MAHQPTYEELVQKVSELENEKRQAARANTSIFNNILPPSEEFSHNSTQSQSQADFDLESLIDVKAIQSIMDDFCALTGMVTAILDLNGKVIESTGWQDICTKFHRIHPKTCHNCTESDLYLAKHLKPGEYIGYKCKNGLWDVVTPLYIGHKHIGNIYTGQFFYDDEIVDEARFVQQAEENGFDKNAYLEAFRRIPRYDSTTIQNLMGFLVKFTTYISKICLSNFQLEREIIERQKAESAQQESVAMLRSLIRAIPDLVWLKDRQGVYLFCNSRFEDFFGASENEIVGKTDYDFLESSLADFFRKHDKVAMANAKPSKNEEEIVFAVDGHHEFLETIKTPLYTSSGEIGGVLGIGRDITDRKRAEEEKEILSSQLQQAQKMEAIGNLAGGVAHDFNNMLGVIIGHSEMAMDQVDPAHPLFADLHEIRNAAERSAEITRQLLAFARKQTISLKILNLNETVEGMLKMLRRLIGEDIELSWLPSPGLWQVKVDPSQIDQILANLCINAKAAIDGVGTISVETKNCNIEEHYSSLHMDALPGEYVRISVTDSGCGMDKFTLMHIFEPFFTTKKFGKGTGLGLSTVFGIVKQNKGFINVYSEPRKGSNFTIYFPRFNGEINQTKAAEPQEHIYQGSETILLIEDEPALLEMTMSMLRRLGYTVVATSSPEEALQLIEKHKDSINLVMTDVIMPGMNGKDLSIRLLATNPDLKFLFMSGYTANVISHHGVLDDGIHFIQKPFSRRDLSEKIRQILGPV